MGWTALLLCQPRAQVMSVIGHCYPGWGLSIPTHCGPTSLRALPGDRYTRRLSSSTRVASHSRTLTEQSSGKPCGKVHPLLLPWAQTLQLLLWFQEPRLCSALKIRVKALSLRIVSTFVLVPSVGSTGRWVLRRQVRGLSSMGSCNMCARGGLSLLASGTGRPDANLFPSRCLYFLVFLLPFPCTDTHYIFHNYLPRGVSFYFILPTYFGGLISS